MSSTPSKLSANLLERRNNSVSTSSLFILCHYLNLAKAIIKVIPSSRTRGSGDCWRPYDQSCNSNGIENSVDNHVSSLHQVEFPKCIQYVHDVTVSKMTTTFFCSFSIKCYHPHYAFAWKQNLSMYVPEATSQKFQAVRSTL